MADAWGPVLALSAGGVLGVNARYWLGYWISRWVTHPFPWATFVINTTGSLAIGFLTVALARWVPHPHVRLFAVVGFLGGYTTFSTFAFDSLTLWERGEIALALANLVGSVAAGFFAVALGVAAARALQSPGSPRLPAQAPGASAGLPGATSRDEGADFRPEAFGEPRS